MSRCLWAMVAAVATSLVAADEWSLSDHLQDVLVYDAKGGIRIPWSATAGGRYQHGGMLLMRCAWRDGDTLSEHDPRMRVGGSARDGQVLLAGLVDRALTVDFTVVAGSRLAIAYGFADYAALRKAKPAAVSVSVETDSGTRLERSFTVAEARWEELHIEVPQGDTARVRLSSERTGAGAFHWPMLVVQGDGRIAPLEVTLAASPWAADLADPVLAPAAAEIGPLTPSPWRVTRPPDSDILYFRDAPFLSFAAKGNRAGFQELETERGFNTAYQEGRTFSRYWAEGEEGVTFDPDKDVLFRDLALCRQLEIPFKTSMSLAHCTPFLPEWLVERDNLAPEGHQSRGGGPTHTSIFKAATRKAYRKGLEGWVVPHREQPTILVFSQEDDPENLDDRSAESQAGWREWLRARFGDDFAAFSHYVGGIQDCDGFAEIPYPERFRPVPTVGFAQRLNWLKMVRVIEAYGDFLADVTGHARTLLPGAPVTQRYVYTPWGVYLSRRVKSDYNYTFGHLTTEARPQVNGVGRKSWTAAHGHVGVLPLPRGGSIGKCWDATIRRGPVSAGELRANIYTLLANGASGFEYQPFFPVWGESWESAALVDFSGNPTELGAIAQKVFAEVKALGPKLHRYERHADVAVFHDAAALSRPFAGMANPSKYGLYTLVRECGYHPNVLTLWDMTPEILGRQKILLLGGSTSLAPEILDVVREYVRGGGTLVAFFSGPGGGFPGCNSYDYSGSAAESFSKPSFAPGQQHLGEVLGIDQSGQAGMSSTISGFGGSVSLAAVNEMVTEGRWLTGPVCALNVVLRDNAVVLATFEDGSPAAWQADYGSGKVFVCAYDLPLLAGNLTMPDLYAPWDRLLGEHGCRKVLDTGNYFVEAGVWQDPQGKRTALLVNHDPENPHVVRLPDGVSVELKPGESTACDLAF